jgi:hypothetical protein
VNLQLISWLWPVVNLLDFSVFWYAALKGTLMPNYDCARRGEDEFCCADCYANVAKSLKDAIDYGKVLSNEATYAMVLSDHFKSAVN